MAGIHPDEGERALSGQEKIELVNCKRFWFLYTLQKNYLNEFESKFMLKTTQKNLPMG